MSDPSKIIGEALTLIADELAEQRDIAVNANKPVIEALGNLLSEVQALRLDLAESQKSTNEQIAELRKRKAAASG